MAFDVGVADWSSVDLRGGLEVVSIALQVFAQRL